MKLGFTGPRLGVSVAQERHIDYRLSDDNVSEVHHGDCIGADEVVHKLALVKGKKIFVHPPTDPKFRAYCTGPPDQVIILPEEPYLDRNHNIVDDTDELMATPEGPEKLRSGTWSTIRYARKMKKTVERVARDGRISREETYG